MKRILLITLLAIFSIGLFAQKSVRKSIRRGNKAFKEQRYSAAEIEYNKAIEDNASSKEASFNLANTYYKQQRWDEALNEYQHYLTLENGDNEKMSGAWSNMGNTFLKKKANEKNAPQSALQEGQQGGGKQQAPDNLQLSMEAYKNALRLNPLDDETRQNLAIVQKMIKDQEGDGGGGDNDQNQDEQDKKEDEKDQDQNQDQDQKQDKKDDQKQEQENQMSQENIQQILEAIEQDEKETQDRVNQQKAKDRKAKTDRNRQQDKDW